MLIKFQNLQLILIFLVRVEINAPRAFFTHKFTTDNFLSDTFYAKISCFRDKIELLLYLLKFHQYLFNNIYLSRFSINNFSKFKKKNIYTRKADFPGFFPHLLLKHFAKKSMIVLSCTKIQTLLAKN